MGAFDINKDIKDIKDIEEKSNHYEKLLFQASHDRLTGLYHADCFYEEAARMIREHPEKEYLVVCLDIYKFKLINDVFGREIGNRVLQEIARRLRRHRREYELSGYLGNDRFVLLVPKQDFEEKVFVEEFQNISDSVENMRYSVRIYIGIYEVNDPSKPVATMCDRAFLAIHTIKGNYQTNVVYYNTQFREDILLEQKLSEDFQDAIANDHVKIFIQPQADAKGRVSGGEALVRWCGMDGTVMLPSEFIHIFENNGLIVRLDQRIWELACMQLQKWKEQGKENLYLSVNISPNDFYFIDIYQTFVELVQRFKIDAKNLRLEITESAFMNDVEKQLKTITDLRRAGFLVEIDDFGSGYSSLNMLKDIEVDVLKVDMEFLRGSGDKDRTRKILNMIVGLAKQLETPVIIEGVETKEQLDFLVGIGCEMFQGYYFGRPMTIEEFEKKYS